MLNGLNSALSDLVLTHSSLLNKNLANCVQVVILYYVNYDYIFYKQRQDTCHCIEYDACHYNFQ